MAAQDVRELAPRVRRAVEGPVPPASPLSDDALAAMTADAIADIILLTVGAWDHALVVTERDEDANFPTEWEIDPALEPEEESVVAYQAAITYFFHQFRDTKMSERIANEGVEWEWSKSANVLRDWIKLLIDSRDKALTAVVAANPAMARYASFLEVRDAVGFAQLEPWLSGGVGGGQLISA